MYSPCLAVTGPGYLVFAFEYDVGCFERNKVLICELVLCGVTDKTIQFKCVLWRFGKHHFKQSVVKGYILGDELFHSSNRAWIWNKSENEIACDSLSVVLHRDRLTGYFRQPFKCLCDVCRMAKAVFHSLRGFVRNVCKRTKACHIDKIIVVELSHVAVKSLSLNYAECSLKHFFGYSKWICKIVGRACRYVSKGYLQLLVAFTQLHHRPYAFRESPVSSGANDYVILLSNADYLLVTVSLSLGGISQNVISASGEHIYYITKIFLYKTLARMGVKNEQHFFPLFHFYAPL